ncbi:chromate transporter [Bacillus weihaiensis]|uniref:Chromate transporter n=1 Tax=Bacillus weihaiensis TaxID=1547283 RepID=A0A1L3MM55_9BACI|nr:chromate transporter [Bacillus weihaiensis]APH03392.1 chromate transporter [Bacillus weihaiensis]
MKNEWKLLVEIFFSFLKIGPVTFGGGYAMIPLIEREVVSRKKWVKVEDVTDVFAVAGSVPGAIAINSATFIGYRIAGIKGAIAAMLGVMLPTFFIVILLSISFLMFKDNPKIEAAFEGIRPAIVALIAVAAFKIGKSAIIDRTTFMTAGVTVLLLFVLNVHPILTIVCGATVGIVLVKVKEKLGYAVKLENQQEESYQSPDYYLGSGI